MKNIWGVVFISLFTLLFSCKKKIKNYPIDADLKTAFNYKVGTYWIYRDSISGIEDSFYVIDNIYSSGSNSGLNYSIEQIQIDILENNVSPIPTFPLTYYWRYFYQENVLEVTFHFNNNSSPTTYDPLINYPFQTYFSIPRYAVDESSDTAQLDTIFDTYIINNYSFVNVAEVNHRVRQASIKNYDDVFYLCPDFGVIKMRLNHPLDSLFRIWELQRWNIVK